MSLLEHNFPPDLSEIWTKDLAIQLANAQGALSGLNEAVSLLHNPNLLMRPLLGKEAESSSRLEGTQASMEDVYRSELVTDPEKVDDVAEIVNYQIALEKGAGSIERRPLNQLIVRQVHKTLMSGVRGQSKTPGAYRVGEVWIGKDGTGRGDARYIPPDAIHVPQLMDELEKFIGTNDTILPHLIKSAVIHHRFEAIHPFNDGNGRTGRLLITLYLLKTKQLRAPMLYPSGYFDKSKQSYINALHKVDTKQDWYQWIMYYLKGIETQAILSLRVARDIDALYKKYRTQIQDEVAHLGLLRVLEYCFVQPYLTVSLVSKRLDIPANTVRRYLDTLEKKNIIQCIDTLPRQKKVYANPGILNLLARI